VPSGELLMDQQRFEDAVEKFDKAFEMEKQKYVLSGHCYSTLIPSQGRNNPQCPAFSEQRPRSVPMETRHH
jgi:hypothetical protein